MMRYVILLVMSVLPPLAGAGTMNGVVSDTSGAVVPEARVELVGAVRREAVTDGEGRFEFERVPDGEYRVLVRREGFAVSERAVTVPTPEVLNFTIQPSPVSTYVVTVSKVEEPVLRTPFLVSAVSREEIEKTGANTLEDALRSIPGLQHGTQANSFTRVSTRGLRDTRDTLVLIDGAPLRQLNGSADLTMIPVQSIQEVELVKGPASAVYGRSAVGGVLQFFTVPPAERGASGDLGFGLASFGSLETVGSASLPWRSGRVAGAGFYQSSDGFQDGVGRNQSALTLMAQQSIADRWDVRINYFLSDVDATRGSIIPLVGGRPAFGVTREDSFGLPDARFEGRLNSITGRVDVALGRDVVLTQTANFNRYDRFFTGGVTIVPPPTQSTKSWFESDAIQDTVISDSMVSWRTSGEKVRSTLVGGFAYERGDQDQGNPRFSNAARFLGPDWLTPVPGPTAENGPKGIRGAVVNSWFDQSTVSSYIQERLEYGRIGATLGLRWDRFDQALRRSNTGVVSAQVRSRLSPRVGVDFVTLDRHGASLVWFANWVEGFLPQFPSLSTRNNVVVPQLLRPEVTRSLESGIRVRSGRWFAQSSYFDMKKVDGQRSFRTSPDDFLFVNATTRVNGIEAEGRTRIGSHMLWAHYAHHNARHLDFPTAGGRNFAGFQLRMSPRHIAGAGALIQILPNLTWAPAINFVGERPLRDNIANPQILPSYTLLSSAVTIQLKQFRIILAGTNLTDTFYISDDFSSRNAGNAGRPRRFSMQIRYRW